MGSPVASHAASTTRDNGGAYPTVQFIRSADSTVIGSSTFPESTPSHDMIVIQIGRERTTGTLALILYGFHPNGMLAAAWQFAHVMPNLQNYTESYAIRPPSSARTTFNTIRLSSAVEMEPQPA